VLSANTVLQNRYRIVRQLGQGGMGTVYEAVDQRLSSVVAIKETCVTTDEARQAFEREASLLANLRHPSLPNVIDHFSENESQYLVMEFIPGDDLAQLLELRGQPFPTTDVLRWADELLKALEYLHLHNPPILHRDIKPSNIKLTREGELFLLDFGLAKGAAGQMPTLQTSRSVKGYTPAYSPLEQIHAGGTDPRSDLYSLGATLYHLLTGIQPIDAPTRFNALDDLQPDPMLLADLVNSQVPNELAQILRQAMAMNRRNRPDSATAMRRLLRKASPLAEPGASTLPKEFASTPMPTAPQLETDPLLPIRRAAPTEPSAPSGESPAPEPTIKEIPNIIERPVHLTAPSVLLATSKHGIVPTRRRISKSVLVFLIAIPVLVVLALGWVLLAPLLSKKSINQNPAAADSTVRSDQQQSIASPSPTPTPSPEFVKVRLRLISQGASGCSVLSGEKVTLTTKNRFFNEVTNRNGFASFSDVPCGDVVKIAAPGIALQLKKGESLSITRNLQCSGGEIYLGSYGDLKGAPMSEREANACFKPY
jgi:serine/threonine protein kinase